jgi:hypothetical protein
MNLQTASRRLWNTPARGRTDQQLRVQAFNAQRLRERCHDSEKQQIRRVPPADLARVAAQILEDGKTENRYQLGRLIGEDALYGTLEDVVKSYRA